MLKHFYSFIWGILLREPWGMDSTLPVGGGRRGHRWYAAQAWGREWWYSPQAGRGSPGEGGGPVNPRGRGCRRDWGCHESVWSHHITWPYAFVDTTTLGRTRLNVNTASERRSRKMRHRDVTVPFPSTGVLILDFNIFVQWFVLWVWHITEAGKVTHVVGVDIFNVGTPLLLFIDDFSPMFVQERQTAFVFAFMILLDA